MQTEHENSDQNLTSYAEPETEIESVSRDERYQVDSHQVDESFIGDENDHMAIGDLRGQDGDFIGALSEYKKAARLAPDSVQHLSRVAEGYAAADQPYKAIEYYQRALQTGQAKNEDADLSEAHIGLGDLCRTFALSAAAIRSPSSCELARRSGVGADETSSSSVVPGRFFRNVSSARFLAII